MSAREIQLGVAVCIFSMIRTTSPRLDSYAKLGLQENLNEILELERKGGRRVFFGRES